MKITDSSVPHSITLTCMDALANYSFDVIAQVPNWQCKLELCVISGTHKVCWLSTNGSLIPLELGLYAP